MIRKTLTTLILTLLPAALLAAVIPDMKFRRLDTRDGLSNSQVNCIFRDSRDNIWIGTAYGLNRYDGYRMKTFYSDKNDTTSMRDNYTDQIMEDGNGKLWLRQGMNYSVYDPVTEQFERNIGRELERYGITEGVERVFIDKHKNIWVKLYEQGFFICDPHSRKAKQIKLGYGEGELKPNYSISDMRDYADGVLMVSYNGEIVYMNGKRGTVEWEDQWMREHGGPENTNYRLFVDQENNFWVPTEQHTYVYMRSEKRWYDQLTELLRSRGITDVPEQLLIWDIRVDRHGWVWIATDHEGLIVADLKGGQCKIFRSNKLDESTISDNTPKHLYIDPTGSVWIGTYKNGVNQYVEGHASIKNIELGDINAVSEDRYGHYWLGTNDRGIIVYDPQSGEQLHHFTTANSGMLGNIVVGTCRASDGSIWFGSYNGGLTHCILHGPDPAQATIVNYRATGDPDGLANNNVWSITEDKWHRIWIGTLGGGIQMLDLKTGKFRTWNTKNSQLPSDYLTSAAWIKKGWLLMGTSWYYCFLNPVTGKLANRVIPDSKDVSVSTPTTVCVMEDSRGLIWQGSTSGAVVYDQKTGQVVLLDMKKGLFGSSVASIVEDKSHNIWVVTDHGVSKVIPQRQDDGSWQFVVRSYTSRDGLQQGTHNQRSAMVTRDGLILIGGQDGLDIINPKELSQTQGKERPIFSGLQLFDADVPVGKPIDGREILDEALDVCRSITLRHNDQFTIQLGSSAGKVNNRKRFVYMLEGFNDNWVRTSELNPNITYNSLSAGSYTLRVRMLNDDGTFGNEESTLDITIQPPFWRTYWALLCYLLLAVGALWLLHRWYTKRNRQRMEAETLRRETEKKQWMSEIRMEMAHNHPIEQPAEQPEPQGIELHTETTDMVDYLRQYCRYYKVPAGKQAKVSFVATAKQANVCLDTVAFSEALTILLNNSVQFSPIDCRISVGVARTADDRVQVQVADNGIGIHDEFKAHAFDAMKGEEGIGLDRVHDIVTAHGGDIRIEDNPGGGTIFVITLPLEPEEVIEDAVMMEDE